MRNLSRLNSLAAVLLAAFLLAADQPDKKPAGPADAGKDKAALKGTWAPTSSESDGNKDAEEDFKQYRLAFDGDGYTIRKGGEVLIKGTFKLDPSKEPKQIDMAVDEDAQNADNNGKSLAGIYAVDGDELKWCFHPPAGGERPKEFASRSGSGVIFVTLKREKQ